mgnify:FL=1|jgi:ISCro4, family IS110
MENTLYVGIDIARHKFDAAFFTSTGKAKHDTFHNNAGGFAAFLQWCGAHSARLHLAMEATNVYHEELAQYLYEQGHTVSIVNPRCIHAYAKSQNLRSKTDKIDATLIARYAAKEVPPAWQPPREPLRVLLLTLRQLERLKTVEQQQRDLLGTVKEPGCVESIKRLHAFLQGEIKRMGKEVKAIIAADERMQHNAKLLHTIPGIGERTVPWLLAYLHDGKRFANGKAAATCAGLTPMLHQSGTSDGKAHISKIGPSEIRKVLYMPAVVYSFGICRDGPYKSFADSMLANGKAKKSVITALMRKLLTIAQAVLQYRCPFDLQRYEKATKK